MATPIQDAVVRIRIDDDAARRQIASTQKERERQQEITERRAREKREREQRQRGRPGGRRGFGRRALAVGGSALVAIAVTEAVRAASNIAAGLVRPEGEPTNFIEREQEKLAQRLDDIARTVDGLKASLGAALGARTDAVGLARAQALLTGQVDTDEVAETFQNQFAIRKAVAEAEAARDRRATQAVAGAVGTKIKDLLLKGSSN